MGWLWGANEAKPKPNPNPNPPTSNTDPARDLDPSLREFLETESPSPHKPSPSPSPSLPSSSPSPPSNPPSTSNTSSPPDSAPPDAVPAAPTWTPPMVHSDGRYADIWATYRPRGVIEEEVRSDNEKLQDVLEHYKHRKELIGRAALENCALEQGEIGRCFREGGWRKRMSLCSAEQRAFERCYEMQSKFLRALGYLSTPRAESIEEKIQMHADTLYHRMLEQEAAIASAKASNAPIPVFPPIFPSPSSPSPSLPESPPPAPFLAPRPVELFSKEHLVPAARAGLEKRLKDKTPEERELTERATAMEASQNDAVARKVSSMLEETERKRKERREKGEVRFGDLIAGLFGR